MSLAISLNAATAIAPDRATFSGTTSGFGADVPTVTLYWGETNGGTTPGLWANSFFIGFASGGYSKVTTSLKSGTLYFFRAAATNATDGTVWSGAGAKFNTTYPPMGAIDATAASRLGAPVASRTLMTSMGGPVPLNFLVSRHYFGVPINTYAVDNARLELSCSRVSIGVFAWTRTWTTSGPPILRYDTSNVGRPPEDLSIGTRLIPGYPPALNTLGDPPYTGEALPPDNGWLLKRGTWKISVQTTIDPSITGLGNLQLLARPYRVSGLDDDSIGGRPQFFTTPLASGTHTNNTTAILHSDPLWDMVINLSISSFTNSWLGGYAVGTTSLSLVVQLNRS